QLAARIAQPGDLDDRLFAEMQTRAFWQLKQIDASRRNVLAHLARAQGEPDARNSSNNSSWIRCTCRRFGALPNFRMRERCLTVAPACASPSTPCPASNVIRASWGLLNVCSALRLTAFTTADIQHDPCPNMLLRLREDGAPSRI